MAMRASLRPATILTNRMSSLLPFKKSYLKEIAFASQSTRELVEVGAVQNPKKKKIVTDFFPRMLPNVDAQELLRWQPLHLRR